MRKTITYSTFTIATLLVVLLFVTAKSYMQLGLAVVLYPAIGYLILNLFPRSKENEHEIVVEIPRTEPLKTVEVKDETVLKSTVASIESDLGITDTNKRDFLKLIGVAGLSFFIFSIFSKRAQIPFFGKIGGGADAVTIKDDKGNTISPAVNQPMDGFQISEIDDNLISYYGFINQK